MPAKHLKVDLDEVVQAMDDHTGAVDWYLDTHTGEVVPLSEELASSDEEDEDGGAGPLAEADRQERELARNILRDDGGRYVHIPRGDSGESYRVMEDFIPRVRDARLRERLADAIAGKGAFRRFKEVLFSNESVREQWFRFEAGVKQGWAREWLASVGIEAPQPARDEPEGPPPPPSILGLHHAQITVPRGQEGRAKQFYCGVLAMEELPKPSSLKGRGGLWLGAGDFQVHVGVEDGVQRDATKAHLAYEVDDIGRWREHLALHGVRVDDSVPIPGYDRFEFRDPFGNRVELIQAID